MRVYMSANNDNFDVLVQDLADLLEKDFLRIENPLNLAYVMGCSLSRTGGAPHKRDGPWAWVVLSCVFLTTWLSGGIGYSFGVYLPILMKEFNESRERAALVGSLNFAFFLCLIIVSSHLCHKYSCQVICAIGHALSAAAFVLSSLPHSIIPLYFSHSFLAAFGSSCIQGSGFLIIGLYFKRRRSLAVGIVASAVGVGAICWGPLSQYLLGIMEWRNIFRLIAGLFVVMSFLTLFYDPNVEKPTISTEENPAQVADRRKKILNVFDTSIWRVPLYTIAVLSNMVACFGHHTAQIHMIKFANEIGVAALPAATLFVFFGSTSVITRIIAGRLCDVSFIRPNHVNQAAETISGISTILLTQATTYTHLVIFTIFYGMADGAFRTTLNILFLDSVGIERMASAFGQANMAISVFAAAGPAVAGAVADHYDSYIPAFYIAGSITLSGSFIYSLLLCWRSNRRTENTRTIAELNESVEEAHANDVCDVGDNELESFQEKGTCPVLNKVVIGKSHSNDACDVEDNDLISQKIETCPATNKTELEKCVCDEDNELVLFQKREKYPALHIAVMEKPHAKDANDVQDTHL